MANALYRQVPNSNDWFRQDGGGPAYMRVNSTLANPANPAAPPVVWFIEVSYDGVNFLHSGQVFGTQQAAQTQLNAYAGQLNAGTA